MSFWSIKNNANSPSNERNGERIKKVQEYPADIGKAGGNKTKRDDHKTPEEYLFFRAAFNAAKIPFNLYGALPSPQTIHLFDQREKENGSGFGCTQFPTPFP